MVSKITKGIKVVVKVRYAGQSLRLNTLLNFFNYEISIENRNSNTVQLLRRYWLIKDSLNNDATVEGEGVVGKHLLSIQREFLNTLPDVPLWDIQAVCKDILLLSI